MGLDSTRTNLLSKEPLLSADACLILIYGSSDLGKRFALTHDTTIGRDTSNDICIDMSFVSRQHARVTRKETRWFVEDLGSRNGTQVNGIPAEGVTRLDNGDQIKVGGAIFKYIAGGNVEALFHEEIYRMTIVDGLTQVHNKRYFMEFLDREMARCSRYDRPLSLLLFDIDKFKGINDTYGHDVGDALIRGFARRLGECIRNTDTAARLGGDEFAVILEELEDTAVGKRVAEKIVGAMREEFVIGERRLAVSTSVGVSFYKGTEEIPADVIVKQADQALYEAKAAGRNTYGVSAEEAA